MCQTLRFLTEGLVFTGWLLSGYDRFLTEGLVFTGWLLSGYEVLVILSIKRFEFT